MIPIERPFRFCAAVKVEGTLFFSCLDYNALYKISSGKSTPEFVGRFPHEQPLSYFLHKECFFYKDKLIFTPENSSYIQIYDIKKQKFNSIYITNYPNRKFSHAESIIFGDFLLIFPMTFDEPVLKLNLVNEMIENDWGFINWCKENINAPQEIKFTRVALYDGKIWLGVYESEYLVSIELDSSKYNLIKTGIDKIFAVFSGSNGIFVASNTSSKFYFMNGNYEFELFELSNEEKEKRPFNHIIEIDDKLLLIPAFDEDITILDKNNKKIKHIVFPVDFIDELSPKFFGFFKNENKIKLYPFNCPYLFEIDILNESFQQLNFPMDKFVFFTHNFAGFNISEYSFGEFFNLHLRDFLDGVMDCNLKFKNLNENIGRKIYNSL